MSRTSRLLELLELLQSAGTRSVPELARRFGIDERTARRDIDALRDLGVPVQSTRGRHGGYRIGIGYRMPPLMLDDEEALAVLVALMRAATDTTTTTDTSTATEAIRIATATAKVRRSLPRHLTERADALLSRVVFVPGPGGRPAPGTVDPETLLTIAAAVRDRRPLAFDYVNRTGGRSSRSLQPHDLVAYAGRWYLVGLDAPTQQVRTFRLDRLATVRTLGGTFPEPAPHDAVADFLARLSAADYRHLVVLRIQATDAAIREHLPASVARLERLDDRWFSATIRAESLEWLPPVLLALDSPVVIERPDELRLALADAAAKLTVLATSTA